MHFKRLGEIAAMLNERIAKEEESGERVALCSNNKELLSQFVQEAERKKLRVIAIAMLPSSLELFLLKLKNSSLPAERQLWHRLHQELKK
jgi:hypothetical protein